MEGLLLLVAAGSAAWLVLGAGQDRRRHRHQDERRRQAALLRILAARLPEPPARSDHAAQADRDPDRWLCTEPGIQLRIAPTAVVPLREHGELARVGPRPVRPRLVRATAGPPQRRPFVPPV
jgi:hypothetical protein